MFQNSDIADVVRAYEKWTGRRVLYNAQLVGPVKIEISEPIPYSEAAKIVEMVLLMNGFALTPAEAGPGEDPANPKIWKITGIGTNPKQAGIPFIEREESLPAGEQVVMFLFKLKWADPTELASTISSGILAPAQAGYTSIIPLPKSNSLLVTENTALIRTLIRVIRAIDVEPAEVVSRFIHLQHAQAEDVVTNLEKLFEKTQQSGGAQAPRVQRPPTNAPQPGSTAIGGSPEPGLSVEINGGNSAAAGPTEDNIIIGKVKLTADKRTNRIHVVSRPVNMKLITELIEEYDANVKLPESLVRPLRFRPVSEVIDAVVSAVKDPGEKDGAGGGAAGGGQRPGLTQNTNNQQIGNNRFGNTAGAGGANGGGSGAGALGESLSTGEQPTNPSSQQVGKSTVIADPWSNSIIVVGTPDVKQKVSALLDELDVRQPQVMIQVIIGELTLKKNEQFGLDYILRNGGVITSAGVGAGTGTTPGTTPGTGTGGGGTTVAGGIVGYNASGQPVLNLNNLLTQQNVTKILAAGSGGLSGFVAGSDAFTATLTALETSNRFRVITTPRIFTTNNKRAIITSGEEVAVPTNIQSSFNNANTNTGVVSNSSIQFKPIELRLEVLPLVNSDKEVSLEIVQNVSERAGTTRIDNNDIPNVSRRALKTYVTVPNNGTLILGGLIKDSQDRTKGGINGLVNIPLIGPLFGKTTKDRTRTELIILMRPVVTMNPPEAVGLREKTMQTFNIPPDLDAAIIPEGIRESIPRAKAVKPAPTPRTTAPDLRRR